MMLKLLLAACILAPTAFADGIVITPGSSVTLTPDQEVTVTCLSQYLVGDYCRCERDGQTNRYKLYRHRVINGQEIKDLLTINDDVSPNWSEIRCNQDLADHALCKL